jgi:hypothetical protein
MYFEKDRIAETPFLSGEMFHRMITAKAKMDITAHSLQLVSVLAPLIASWRRNDHAFPYQVGERMQTTVLANEVKIAPICEVIQTRDLIEGVNSHGLSPEIVEWLA